MRDKIIAYLEEKYSPHTIILYGSFADCSNNANSDFDALIITDKAGKCHDSSFVEETELDVFVYPSSEFEGEIDYENFLGVFDGNIVLDKFGVGKKLKDGVIGYIESLPEKTGDELLHEVKWCEKMLLRAKRGDAEGFFRWHWLLEDSLEIYFDLRREKYFGSKKALKKMKAEEPEAFSIYEKALSEFEHESLEKWVDFLKTKI